MEKTMGRVFQRAEILLPYDCDMTKWSVVACDQFSSQPEYWATLEQQCEGVPSTLHLMLPEAYLERCDQLTEAQRINTEMKRYLDESVFRVLPESYVYVERTLQNGVLRRGLLGVLDLEAYDFAPDSTSPVRATEGTVESRLPLRVRVRAGAALEMPHIMVFIDDPAGVVIPPLTEQKAALPPLYDFALSAGGGHIAGWQVSGATADAVDRAVDTLFDPAVLRERCGDAAPVVFAMGDGNHSLATAKRCWEQLKPQLDAAERETHPARYSLVELVNIHDPAITFESIHRCIFETDPAEFLRAGAAALAAASAGAGAAHTVRLVTVSGEESVELRGLSIGAVIGSAERFCQEYIARHGGRIDYVHNDDTALSLGQKPDSAALLLPKMEKAELFPSIVRSGPFPKKSFSIGKAEDKRYYLECRRIQ
ncbi:MAG: DUF1015 domain-containing protein [Oscillospiraceae bacterium]|nr:DUF1015 domain-containing protein [Oscillospiraceae bacterium]